MRALLAVLVLGAALGSAAPASAADPWSVAEVVAPAGTTRIFPEAINDAGVIVGSARFPGRNFDTPFRWEDGRMEELPLPANAMWARALDVNDKGVIVGFYEYDINPNDQYGNSDTNALRWEDNAFQDLGCCFPGTAPAPYGNEGSAAEGINESGIITGLARQTTGSWCDEQRHAFSWNGSYTDLSEVSDCNGSHGLDINESGAVIAWLNIAPSDRGALYKGGVRTVLAVDPGDNGINDLGHVVGQRPYESNKQQIARLWNGETYVDLGVEGTPSMAYGINNSDWAVGRSGIAEYQPGGGTAYLWRPGMAGVSLNSLIENGWNLERATDVNDGGVIVGHGFHGTTQVGFIVTPAGLAYELTGKVTDGAGAALANVPIRVLRGDGSSAGEPVKTDAEGKYKWTLPRGEYRVTAMPEGGFGVVVNPACKITLFHCDIPMTRNRTVDFQAVAATPGPAPGFTTSPGPSVKPDRKGPELALSVKTLKLDKKGVVQFPLPAFAEAVTGTIVLKSGKTTIGSAKFTAAKGKAAKVKVKLNKKGRALVKRKRRVKVAAVVTAHDALANATSKTLKVTLTR